jgi:hypothetical protein
MPGFFLRGAYMSDGQYRVPFRQNEATMIMGVEAPKLMGSIVLWVGMSILGFSAIGIGMAVGYWIFYNKAKQNAGMKGGVVHTLWRNGLWADGKKYKYNPIDPDLYS